MNDEKVTYIAGGILVPKVAYIDRVKDGLLWSLLFKLSRKIINLGLHIQSICMQQEEIHPYDALMKAMSEMKAIRDNDG